MKVKLICMGDKMPAWVSDAYGDYAKRLQQNMDLELKELSLLKRAKSNASAILKKESQLMMNQISDQDHVVVLDVLGKQCTTPELATRLERWQEMSRPVSFCVGGPEGLHADVLERADEKLSLSKLTMPHPLVRVVFIEQLYRAMSILNNHPYHRE